MIRIGRTGTAGAQGATLLDEEAAVRRSVEEPAAFAPLFDRYYPAIVAFCWRRLGRREDAEDGAAEVFRKAFAARAAFGGGSFRAWLYAIAVNTMRDLYKRPAAPCELPSGLCDAAPGPEERAILATSL